MPRTLAIGSPAFRVAQLLPGVGPASAEKIVAAAGSENAFEALRAYQPPAKAREAYVEFVDVLERVQSRRAVAEVISAKP